MSIVESPGQLGWAVGVGGTDKGLGTRQLEDSLEDRALKGSL